MEELDEGPEFVVHGFQFESLTIVNQAVESSSEDSVEDDVDDQSALVPCNTDW